MAQYRGLASVAKPSILRLSMVPEKSPSSKCFLLCEVNECGVCVCVCGFVCVRARVWCIADKKQTQQTEDQRPDASVDYNSINVLLKQ